MNFVVRKLSMLKMSIEEKELVANKSGKILCSSDIKIKNNINMLFEKLNDIKSV